MSIDEIMAKMVMSQGAPKLREYVNDKYYIDTCFTVDHGWETMVFSCDADHNVTDWGELDADWYASFEEAQKGHKAMVEKWKER